MSSVLSYEATRFPLVNDETSFLQAIQTGRCAALRFPILDYRQMRLELQRCLAQHYTERSRQFMDLLVAPLHCAGCLWEFPQSYCAALFLGRTLEKEFSSIAGAQAGHAVIADTGVCPLCGFDEGVLLYEYYDPAAGGPIDLKAIRAYWENAAVEWWSLAEEGRRTCADCRTRIVRDQGCLADAVLLCATCADRKLSRASDWLASSPHYLGNNLLRKARAYRQQQSGNQL